MIVEDHSKQWWNGHKEGYNDARQKRGAHPIKSRPNDPVNYKENMREFNAGYVAGQMKYSSCYLEGYLAGSENVRGIEDNPILPYPPETNKGIAWNDGFKDGYKDYADTYYYTTGSGNDAG